MTGLLQRLAARATGTAWTVRADTRLSFNGAGGEDAQDSAPPLTQQAPASDERVPAQVRTPPPLATAPPMAAPLDAHRPVVADQPEALQRTSTKTRAAKGRPAPATPVAQPQQPAPLVPRATTPPIEAHAATTEDAVVSTSVPPRASGQLPLIRPRHEDPAPLLPPRPENASHAAALPHAAQRPVPSTVRPVQQSAASQETEVHIHIGRIEVTALQEASRPKAKPRERTQPVSLDAYLAARSRP